MILVTHVINSTVLKKTKSKSSLSPYEYDKIGNYTDATTILLNKYLNTLTEDYGASIDWHEEEINNIEKG